MLASSGETAQDNPKLVAEGWSSQQHPNLFPEQGLDSIFPVPDALAQLCLLDKLLGGGDEEFLWKDQWVLPAHKGPGRPTAPTRDPGLPHFFGPAPHISGTLA